MVDDLMFSAPAPESLRPGSLLADRYHVERLLGADQAGRRYLALDTEHAMGPVLLQEVLVPSFPTRAARDEAARWLTDRVARLRLLAHPGIAAVHDCHVPPALAAPFYIALAYVPGLTPAEELEEADGALSWRQALDWGISLCDTLEYLHRQRPAYVHGALRPHTIVVDSQSARPMLIDLGLARWLNPAPGDRWGYVPFEQYIGREEPRSDLYSLGALLYTLLCGYDPDADLAHLRRAGSDVQRAQRRLFPPLDADSSGIPAALAAALARATAFTIDDRFPSAAALGEALRAVRGPAVEVEAPAPPTGAEEPVWVRLGLTQHAWFALPIAERNRRLLGLVHPPTPDR
ncbi:MAG TPA: protein kinase [Chloroflexota bacterium]|nr:protein kinase [Chloroflexota bacterium]